MANRFGLIAALVLFTVVGGMPVPAAAHIKLKMPTAQDPNNPLKTAPCGSTAVARGTSMTMFKPSETITVQWDETIQHPGHYRIAFDDDGQDFADPDSFEDIKPAGTDLGKGVIVLADGIADKTSRAYEQKVTLPSKPCDKCTLQLIQMMTDKAPYGNGDDVYHECANLVLRGDAASAAGSPAAGSGAVAGGGGTPAAGMTGAAAGASGSTAAAVAAGGTAAAAGSVGMAAGPSSSMAMAASVAPARTASLSQPSSAGANPTASGASGSTAALAAPNTSSASDTGGGCSVANTGGAAAPTCSVFIAALFVFGWRRRLASAR